MRNILIILSLCALLTCCKSTITSSNSTDLDYALNDTLSRKELLLNIPIQKQIRLSKSLSPAIQAKLWSTKIEDTLSSPDLSSNEKDVIKMLVPFIKEESFSGNNSMLANKCEEVGKILTEQFDWDEEKLFIYLSNFYTQEEYKQIVSSEQ